MDHIYPLNPDVSLDIFIHESNKIKLPDLAEHSNFCWYLEVSYTSNNKFKLPCISIYLNEKEIYSQFFESNQKGKRLVNLTGLDLTGDISFKINNCSINSTAKLFGFKKPKMESNILIIAPHPDDAELAAYGFYRNQNDKVWIVTITAGDSLSRLEKQYIPNLDNNLTDASLRKGIIRAWNSITTPILAGVAPEKNIMLGYFDESLTELVKEQDKKVLHKLNEKISPNYFRKFNRDQILNNSTPENSGKSLVQDLKLIIEHAKPSIIVVTHPEIDPHPDHIATAKACALALQDSTHKPEHIFMYANHLHNSKGFPWGPIHSAGGVWPWKDNQSKLGKWSLYSESLDLELQKEKAVALDSMYDLKSKLKLKKRIKRIKHRYLTGVPLGEWKDYGEHEYFQTHIKAHETFTHVKTNAFIVGVLSIKP